MRAAILDYGCGNLRSLANAIKSAGVEPVMTSDVAEALACDALFLPGVGAFATAAAFLSTGRDELSAALREGMPCMGICLGMQLLFDRSEEGEGAGLGVIAGSVRRLVAKRVPQMGWNTLDDIRDPMLIGSELATAYFANSYVCDPADAEVVTAWVTHESDRFPVAVRSGSIVGLQFHPEKSSAAGLRVIGRFLDEAGR